MKAVIDTNVLLVASGAHDDVSVECKKECVRRLHDVERSGTVVIDDGFRLLKEYSNKISSGGQKTVGKKFLEHLYRNRSTASRVDQVALTDLDNDMFEEFPDPDLQPVFDAPDRKFVAVANAHPEKPPIWQAADSKWLDWWKPLKDKGIDVDFLCPNDVRRFYRKKFPSKPAPTLPKSR